MYQGKKLKDRAANAATWKALADHVVTNEEAYELLQRIFYEIGPYNDGKVHTETMLKLQRFFNWDDSE